MAKVITLPFYSASAKTIVTDIMQTLHKHSLNVFGNQVRRCIGYYDKVEFAPNGQVTLNYTGPTWHQFSDISSNEVLHYIAVYLKKYVYTRHGKFGWNDRAATDSVTLHRSKQDPTYSWRETCEDITYPINEIRYMYEIFMGRKNIKNKYSAELVSKFEGEELNPILAELEVSRRAEEAKINEDLKSLLNQLSTDRDQHIREFRENENKRYDDAVTAAKLEAKSKIAELNKTFSEVANASAA